MALCTSFDELKAYKLSEIRLIDQELGHGSYATVLEVEYMGLKCAGKKIHDELVREGVTTYGIHRFKEECCLLSQVRHPNIVQFLGVHFQQGVRAPILVMEFLPTNLTSCIEQYGILPKEISYSILHDVALGLRYLHSRTPAIIHRDLSSNNVLLTPNMTAKISDLGVARILNLTPLQVSHMTQTPGTPHFMPPEVMIPNPVYNVSVDIFSCGIMLIHVFSGMWPEPQIGPNKIEAGKLMPVSEAERREVFLRIIGNDHPTMDLILKCINNDSKQRPIVRELEKRLAKMMLQFPSRCFNPLELLCPTKVKRTTEAVQHENDRMRATKGNLESLRGHESSNDHDAKFQLKHLQLLTEDLRAQTQILEYEKKSLEIERNSTKAEIISLKRQTKKQEEVLNDAMLSFEQGLTFEKNSAIAALQEEHKHLIEKERRLHEQTLQTERQNYRQILQEREEECLRNEAALIEQRKISDKLRVESITSKTKIDLLSSNISTLEETLAIKAATVSSKDTELEVKTKALQQKEDTISGMSEQLTRAMEYLATKRQTLQAKITWKQCADLPLTMCNGKTVIINNNIYFRGMGPDPEKSANEDDDNVLFCYDHKQDSWTALPPLPVKWFGLGHVDGKLVAVGGLKKDEEATNNIYALNFVQKWKPSLPPMPTARCLAGVVSLQSALIVIGGYSAKGDTNVVEIFNVSTLQWFKTSPLPAVCREVSLVTIDDTCYAVGGYKFPFRLNQALYASINELLRNAVPANQTTHSGSSDTQSVWKTLPNTPTYRPAAAVLAGSLLAAGGGESSIGESDKKEVYMYSPSTNSWIYISDLPVPRSRTTMIELSSTEVIIIGGVDNGERVSTVYKGTLQIYN